MQFKPSTVEGRRLTLAGLPGYVLAERQYRLNEYISSYTSSTDGLKPIAVKAQEQIDDYEKVMADPVHSPYVMVIGSEPNDLKAKALAASIMLRAQQKKQSVLWHTVIGGYKDPLRDKPASYRKHDLLIFSNVAADSTDLKFEKLRDLLEIYSGVPRIVVTTGCEPIKLFNEIGYHLNYSVWLRGQRSMRTI